MGASDVSSDVEQGGQTVTTRLNPYLGFRDNAKQALEFYQASSVVSST